MIERERTADAQLSRPVDRAALIAQIVEWNDQPLEGAGGLAVLEVKVQNGAIRSAVARHTFTRGTTDVAKLGNRIADQMEDDAYQVRGVEHVYVVHAYFGEQSNPAAHCRRSARWDDLEPADYTHAGSNRAGDNAIMQKHARDAIAGMVENGKDSRSERKALLVAWSDERDHYVGRCRELEAQVKAMTDEVQEAKDRKQEREIKAEREKALLEWGREIVASLKNHAPILINHFAGQQVMPVPDWAHPVVVILQRLYERITRNEETLTAVMEALYKDDDAFKLFGELMSTVEDQNKLTLVRSRIAIEAAEGKRPTVEDAPATADAKPKTTNGHRAPSRYGFRGLYG